jgi:hypothetical protein
MIVSLFPIVVESADRHDRFSSDGVFKNQPSKEIDWISVYVGGTSAPPKSADCGIEALKEHPIQDDAHVLRV